MQKGLNVAEMTKDKDEVGEPKGRAIGALQQWQRWQDKSDRREVQMAFTTSTDNDGRERVRETGENEGGQSSLVHSRSSWVFIQEGYLILAYRATG